MVFWYGTGRICFIKLGMTTAMSVCTQQSEIKLQEQITRYGSMSEANRRCSRQGNVSGLCFKDRNQPPSVRHRCQVLLVPCECFINSCFGIQHTCCSLARKLGRPHFFLDTFWLLQLWPALKCGPATSLSRCVSRRIMFSWSTPTLRCIPHAATYI